MLNQTVDKMKTTKFKNKQEERLYYQNKVDALLKKVDVLQQELLHYDSMLQNYTTKLELLNDED